jgi:S1-C subfamily serine protease
MPRGLDVDAMYARADRTLATSDIGAAHDRFRNLVGPLPEEMTDLARAAYDSLRNGEHPGEAALHALEIAIRMHRPAVVVRDGVPDPLPDEAEPVFPQWASFVASATGHLGAVGAIEKDGALVGTAFAIGATSVVTNRHVVDALTGGSGTIEKGHVTLRLAETVPVVDVVARHDTLDLAVLRIESQHHRPFPISERPPQVGSMVAAIGYPDADPRSGGFDQLLFADGLGVQRVSPGEVTGQRHADFFHDCSTLGGSSGSPVVSLDDASLVGVHADGYFLARNEGIVAASAVEFLRDHA